MLALLFLAIWAVVSASALPQAVLSPGDGISIGSIARVLGPFSIGTRESPLGLRDDWRCDNASTYSRLVIGGRVSWTTVPVQTKHGDSAIDLRFDDARSSDIVQADGWSALQFEAFVTLDLHVNAASAITTRIGLAGGVEFAVARRCADAQLWYAGDLYGTSLGHAVPLYPGAHCFIGRYAHDVRASGGRIPPVGHIAVSAHVAIASGLAIVSSLTVAPSLNRTDDGDVRASEFVGVTIVSGSDDWLCVDRAVDGAELVEPVRLAPRQTQNIALRLIGPGDTISAQLHYRPCSHHPAHFSARELKIALEPVTAEPGDDAESGEPARCTRSLLSFAPSPRASRRLSNELPLPTRRKR